MKLFLDSAADRYDSSVVRKSGRRESVPSKTSLGWVEPLDLSLPFAPPIRVGGASFFYPNESHNESPVSAPIQRRSFLVRLLGLTGCSVAARSVARAAETAHALAPVSSPPRPLGCIGPLGARGAEGPPGFANAGLVRAYKPVHPELGIPVIYWEPIDLSGQMNRDIRADLLRLSRPLSLEWDGAFYRLPQEGTFPHGAGDIR